jgi:paired amphipathic helix protein Sin3a
MGVLERSFKNMMPNEQAPRVEKTATSPELIPTLDDTLNYMRQIEAQFTDKPEVYKRFLGILKDFGSGVTNTPGVVGRVRRLFAHKSNLIRTLNPFLPPEHRIGRPVFWESLRETTPTGTNRVPTSPFPFFRLPAELRMQIYNEALIKLVKLQPPKDDPPLELVVHAKNFADPNMRLVSKQFRDEYMYEAEKKTNLIVEDTPDYEWTFVRVPCNVQYVRKLEVYVRTVCQPCSGSLHGEPTFCCPHNEMKGNSEVASEEFFLQPT